MNAPGRRSQPAPLPARVSRDADGVLHFGHDAWFQCSWCGSYFDTATEPPGCPLCVAVSDDVRARHLEELRLAALDVDSTAIH